MHITIISGSGRANSQSRKIADWFAGTLDARNIANNVIDLSEETYLPITHEEVWSDVAGEPADKIQAKLNDADGYVVITPEWAGMASPALKNFFLYVGKSMADKPTLPVGVSSGLGGQYPVTELRSTSHKNTRILYIPEQLIVRHAEKVMNTATPSTDDQNDAHIQQRAHYDIGVLLAYAEAMAPIRTSGATDYEKHPHGM